MILRDFHALCERHGLQYFLGGGSAIGLVRHGGFIPWDDDIDVGLLRPDHDRFVELAKKELADKYVVVTAADYADYPLMTTRLVLRGTVFHEECYKHLRNLPLGIFLDIYAYDDFPDDERLARRMGLRAWMWGKLLILYHVPRPVVAQKGWRAAAILAASGLAWAGLRFLGLFGLGHRFLWRRALKATTRYVGRTDVPCSRAAWLFDTMPMMSVVKKAETWPTKKAQFQGQEVQVAADTTKYLERRYGPGYMTPPPPSAQHNHPPWKLDFGPYGDA